jgi:N-formylglutamate amidohydrolase
MENPVYSLKMPAQWRSCAVFNSPHSGADYPREFLDRTRLGPVRIRSSEDAFVDRLFGEAPEHGAPLMAARVPRACVDLNRSADDLDPALIAGAPRRFLNPRIAAGLGVIPRVVAEGAPILEGKLQLAEATRRLAEYWHPYHATLKELLVRSRELFGMGILFDCHSMPHDALVSAPDVWGRRPNVILGDRFGTACARWLTDAAADVFSGAGFVVARNAPFAGGYITQTYGRPKEGVHALQIEIDRSLYMDEAQIVPGPDYAEVAERLGRVVAALSDLGVRPLQVAAE